MNTFNAASSIPSTAARRLIREAWKVVARQKKATAAQHAAYCLLLGKDLDKAFPPLKRESKIQGYASGNPYQGRDAAKSTAEQGAPHAWAPWAEFLKDLPRSKGWGQFYEGGLPAVLNALEAHVEKSQASLESPRTSSSVLAS